MTQGKSIFFCTEYLKKKKNIKQVTILIRTHKYVKGDNLPTTAPSAHQNPSELWHGVSSESLCILDYQEAGTLWRKQTRGSTKTEMLTKSEDRYERCIKISRALMVCLGWSKCFRCVLPLFEVIFTVKNCSIAYVLGYKKLIHFCKKKKKNSTVTITITIKCVNHHFC